MNFRNINRTDLVVAGGCILTAIVFLINTRLASVIPLYISSLIVIGIFTYWAIRVDVIGILRRSLVIGGIGGFFYTFVDKLFVELRTVTYIAYVKRGAGIEDGIMDIPIFSTPASVVLVWICCITVVMYLYQRLSSAFEKFYIPALLTGVIVFLGTAVLGNLGHRIWVWSFGATSSPGIGSIPIFVPVALSITFLLSPYIIGGQRISRRIRISDNLIVSGLRCAVILSITIYLTFMIFTGYGRVAIGG
jgi:hypothetical protein